MANENFSLCSEHSGNILKYFCIDHDKPICLICKRQSHRKICEVENLEDAITETTVGSISERLLTNIDGRFSSLSEKKSQKEEALKQDESIFETALISLSETREKINVCIDKLEKNVRQKIESQRDLKLSPIKNALINVTVSMETLSEFRNEVKAQFKNKNVDATTRYLQLLNIEKKYNDSNNDLDSCEPCLKNSFDMNLPSLVYKKTLNGLDVSTIIKDYQDEEIQIGAENTKESLDVGSSVVELEENNLSTSKVKSVLNNPLEVDSIDDITKKSVPIGRSNLEDSTVQDEKIFRFKYSFQVEGSNMGPVISDLKLMPNKLDIVVGERSKQRIMLYTKLGKKKGFLNIGWETDSIAVIDDKKIAVSLTKGRQIAVIDVYAMIRVKFITTDYDVKGLCFFQGNLYVNHCDRRLVCMTTHGNELWSDKNLNGGLYFYIDEDGKLFSVKLGSKSIKVYNVTNKKQSTFSLRGLECPSGMVKENNGNLLIACNQSNKILLKTSTNYSAVVLLDSSDGINAPWSIDFDNENNELIVVNGNNFDIEIYAKT